ncbi:MAG TPA: DUF177 domain-containing protein [Alphaproteobacteria bacterium]|jgi:uncharacterized metal-binding protein YceD (DUF177 family)|nr:DUF177 domain-containing protein [Alphaproteobacteria bacterium]
MKSHDHPISELSRRISIASVPESGEGFRIDASEAERQALARRFELVDLPELHAEGVLTVGAHGRRARLEGRIQAQVVQSCVVTLDPVPAEIDAPFVRLYSADSAATPSADVDVDLEADDPPDPIVGGGIDVGEAVAEELGLALDPYPRAPGAVLEQAEAGVTKPIEGAGEGSPETRRESPFAALKGLVKKP